MLAALVDDVQVNRPRPVRGKKMVLNLSLLTDQAGVLRVGDYLEQVSQETDAEVRFTGPGGCRAPTLVPPASHG